VLLKNARPPTWLTLHDVICERELIEDREPVTVHVNLQTDAQRDLGSQRHLKPRSVADRGVGSMGSRLYSPRTPMYDSATACSWGTVRRDMGPSVHVIYQDRRNGVLMPSVREPEPPVRRVEDQIVESLEQALGTKWPTGGTPEVLELADAQALAAYQARVLTAVVACMRDLAAEVDRLRARGRTGPP